MSSPRRLKSSRVEAKSNQVAVVSGCLGLGQAEIRDTADVIICVCGVCAACVCVCGELRSR